MAGYSTNNAVIKLCKCHAQYNPLFTHKTGFPRNEFPCSDVPPNIPTNVTELQFCDGVADCVNGSDELAHCSMGMCEPAWQ